MTRSPRSALAPRHARVAVALGAVGLFLAGGSLAAADPTPSALAAAETAYQSATDHLESAREQVSVAAEDYHEAKIRLAAAEKDAKAATAAAARAKSGVAQARSVVRRHAVQAWQSGGLAEWEPLVMGVGPSDLGPVVAERNRARLAGATGTANLATVEATRAAEATTRLRQAATASKRAESTARSAQARAESEAGRVGQQRTRLLTQMAGLRGTTPAQEQTRMDALTLERQQQTEEAVRLQMLSTTPTAATSPQPTRQSVRVEAQGMAHQRFQEAAVTATAKPLALRTASPSTGAQQQAALPAPTLVTPTPRPTPSSTPTAPAPATGASAAVAYAKAQLGKWYQWGGAGPDTFDCSGLTMMAWRQGGVYLSHGSQAQYRETRRVAIKDLQPGDLVFYGATPETNHHVGIYVGGGQMIEAPRTGYQVRYASIYRSDLLPYGGRP